MPPRVSRQSKSPAPDAEGAEAPATANEATSTRKEAAPEPPRPRLEAESPRRQSLPGAPRRARSRAKDDDKRPYIAETKEIKVSVKPTFLEDQSSPTDDHYVWAYHVRIENGGKSTVQLINRHWRITDARGRMQEVRGRGVVGEQPVLKPGQTFEYTSGVPLSTPSGIMFGTYEMDDGAGTTFQVKVPAFSLDSPHQARQLH